MDVDPGLRRTPRPGLPDGPGDPRLVARLADVIARDGPITFARFMAVALYDPEAGYYTSGPPRPTRAGDFLTAPELHPVFGRLVARQLTEVWDRLGRPDPFVVREPGASTGALGLAMLDGLALDGSALLDAIRYEPMEVDPSRGEAVVARLTTAGHGPRIARPRGSFVGAVVANEVLDALPVHRVRGDPDRPGGLAELYVDRRDDAFVTVAGPPSTPALAERLDEEHVSLVDGQVAEVCLLLDDWFATSTADLRRGLVLVVDYGWPAAVLYAAERGTGSLRAYAGHVVHDDPFRLVGQQDLTAHVDLTAVRSIAGRHGLGLAGEGSLAEFVAGLGLGPLLAASAEQPARSARDLAEHLELRAAVARLLDPAALGGFAVQGFGRDLRSDPPLAGFAWRLPADPGARIP